MNKFVARVRFADNSLGLTKSCDLDELIEAVRSTLPADLIYQVIESPDGKIELKEIGYLGLTFKKKESHEGQESNGDGEESIERRGQSRVVPKESGRGVASGVSGASEESSLGSDSKLGT